MRRLVLETGRWIPLEERYEFHRLGLGALQMTPPMHQPG